MREDQDRHPAELVLDWEAPKAPPRTLEIPGIEWRTSPSALSGGTPHRVHGDSPQTWTVPKYDRTVPVAKAKRPRAYWVPPAWSEVIERLELQGLRVERQNEHHLVAVEMTRIREPKLAAQPFEGRVRVSARFEAERRANVFPPGTVRVPTDQPLGDLLMLLLEPASPDSFFAWGFFHEVLQPTEYVEAYVMEPMAERMLAEDPALRAEFEKRLREDPAFRAGGAKEGPAQEAFLPTPTERLQWFYERTPFFDERAFLYPIGREMP